MRTTSPSQEMTINSSKERKKKKRRRYRQFSLNCNQHRARRSHATWNKRGCTAASSSSTPLPFHNHAIPRSTRQPFRIGGSLGFRFFPRQNKLSQPALIQLMDLLENFWNAFCMHLERLLHEAHACHQTTASTSTHCAFQRYMASPTAHILKLYRLWAVRRANPSDRLRRTASPLRNHLLLSLW